MIDLALSIARFTLMAAVLALAWRGTTHMQLAQQENHDCPVNHWRSAARVLLAATMAGVGAYLLAWPTT